MMKEILNGKLKVMASQPRSNGNALVVVCLSLLVLAVTLPVRAGVEHWGVITGKKTVSSGRLTVSDKVTDSGLTGGTVWVGGDVLVKYVDSYNFTAAADGECRLSSWWTDHATGYGALRVTIVGDGHNNVWNGSSHVYDETTRSITVHKGLSYSIQISSVLCDNQSYSFTVLLPGADDGGGDDGGGEIVTSYPDLRPITVSGYGSSLIVSNRTGDHYGSTSFYESDSLYVSWSVGCYNKSIYKSFYVYLYVDGNVVKQWKAGSGASTGGYVYIVDFALGRLSAGSHKVRLVADAEGDVAESNESNNAVEKTVSVSARTYTLFFNANGGLNSTSAKLVTYGKEIGALPTPTRIGYTFAGWYTTAAATGGSRAYSWTTMTAAYNVTLHARWTANTYSVTLNANGGTCSQSSKTVSFGSALGFLPTPARKGYDFDGWWYGGTTRVTSSTWMTVANNVTLYAHWTKTVPNAGSCRTAAIPATIGAGILTAQIPLVAEYADEAYGTQGVRYYRVTVKRGRFYTFATPHGGVDLEVSSDNSSVDIVRDADQSLDYLLVDTTAVTAAETYVYVRLAGRIGETVTLHYAEGNHVPVGRMSHPEILAGSGYGGACQVSGTRRFCNWSYSFAVDVQPNVLYDFSSVGGRWPLVDFQAEDENRIYLVHLDGNEDTADGTQVYFKSGIAQRVVLTVLTTPKTTSAHDYGQDCEFSARWAFLSDDVGLSLLFDPNGGECPQESKGVDYMRPVGELPVPSRDGYAFDGWYTAKTGGVKVTEETLMSVTYDVVMQARWIWLKPGCCQDSALSVAVDSVVRSGGFSLVEEWTGDEYGDRGVLHARFRLKAGRVYTFAKPADEVSWSGWERLEIKRAKVGRFDDGRLEYLRLDLTGVDDPFDYGFDFRPVFDGAVGERSLLYYVEGDYVPAGASSVVTWSITTS